MSANARRVLLKKKDADFRLHPFSTQLTVSTIIKLR